jgi:hypothetical protein
MNRRQFTSINGTDSWEAIITCGVMQGSVLGPLLFPMKVNGLNIISNILYYTLMICLMQSLGKNYDYLQMILTY